MNRNTYKPRTNANIFKQFKDLGSPISQERPKTAVTNIV